MVRVAALGKPIAASLHRVGGKISYSYSAAVIETIPVDCVTPQPQLTERGQVGAADIHFSMWSRQARLISTICLCAVVAFQTISEKWYSLELGNHLKSFAHFFDEFYLIADDPVYIDPLRTVLPKEFSEIQLGSFSHKRLTNRKLLTDRESICWTKNLSVNR
jgi:hypothetical protein